VNDVSEFDTYDCLLDLVKKRRSTRKFKPDPVPAGYIEKIIEVARWAPSGFHTQPWEFVVIDKQEVRQAIIYVLDRHAPPITKDDTGGGSLNTSRLSFRDAPVFIILLSDWRAKVGLPGHPKEVDGRVTKIYDSSLASVFLYMHLAAASLGLASQWYSAAANPEAEREIKRIIGIPESLTIYDMMVLGYQGVPPDTKEVRDFDGMVHYNDCGIQDFRTDEQVIAYAQKTWAWCMAQH
jgi:nitroreductase